MVCYILTKPKCHTDVDVDVGDGIESAPLPPVLAASASLEFDEEDLSSDAPSLGKCWVPHPTDVWALA